MTAVASGEVAPTLRLYGWVPPCLSLGYGQRAGDVDRSRLAAREWEIVRRPTGGSAILHTDELTYSVALPIEHELARGGVVESYRRISSALQSALMRLGVQPRAERAESPTAPKPVCFETPSHYEITVEGRKLIGSAQVRRRNGLLQHGTLPLTGDISRICEALVYPDEQARAAAKAAVRARAITLSEALRREVDWQTAADAVTEGFAEALDIAFTSEALSASESAVVERLTAEIYGGDDWTFRR
jgi:lipoate-protein ligase A